MASRAWVGSGVLVVAVVFAACGGATFEPAGSGDDAGRDAQRGDSPSGDDDVTVADAPSDSPAYLACMDASGKLADSLKACKSDTDCVIKQEQIDCCGTILFVGVDVTSTKQFDVCETAWVAHFPGCGCATDYTETEDGKRTTLGIDAGGPLVRCTNFTSNGGLCLTYTP